MPSDLRSEMLSCKNAFKILIDGALCHLQRESWVCCESFDSGPWWESSFYTSYLEIAMVRFPVLVHKGKFIIFFFCCAWPQYLCMPLNVFWLARLFFFLVFWTRDWTFPEEKGTFLYTITWNKSVPLPRVSQF